MRRGVLKADNDGCGDAAADSKKRRTKTNRNAVAMPHRSSIQPSDSHFLDSTSSCQS